MSLFYGDAIFVVRKPRAGALGSNVIPIAIRVSGLLLHCKFVWNGQIALTLSALAFNKFMKAESIRNELMEWLSSLDDKGILTSLLQFKKSAEAGDWSDNLTKEQVESLQRGLTELEQGS